MPGEIINYNGVPLHIINQKEISRTHLYSDDRTTYECTRWVFDVKTVLNPGALNSSLHALPLTTDFAGVTDTIVRNLLAVPRRQLIFVQNGVNVLICPLPGFTTDARNGPIVEEFDLIRDTGMKTWFVFIRIICHVRECPPVLKPGSPINYYSYGGQSYINPYTAVNGGSNLDPRGALISNRWSRRMVTDEDYLSYVETTGECIFDSAWLQSAGVFPDQFRIDLFQPIPPNCKRDAISVEQLADGFTYRYSFRDQERHFNTLPATRIECYQTEGFTQNNFATAAAEAIQGGFFGAIEATMAGTLTGIALAELGVLSKVSYNTIRYQVPKFHSHIVVRAWGWRGQDKMDLLQQAAGIAFERMTTNRAVEMIVTFDRAGKYVQLELTNKTGAEEIAGLSLGAGINLTAKALTAVNKITSAVGVDMKKTIDFLNTQQFVFPNGLPPNPQPNTGALVSKSISRTFANLATGEDSQNLWYAQDETEIVNSWIEEAEANNEDAQFTYYGNNQPPFDNYTRGTLLCNLISQSLHDPCQNPPCPPKVYNANGNPIWYPPVRTCQPNAQPVPIDYPEPPPLALTPTLVPGGPQENQMAEIPPAQQRIPPLESVEEILNRAQAGLNEILNP